MISTFTKTSIAKDKEKPMESILATGESKQLDHIKTTNFMRKLRKIDSTENILKFVQITEYKAKSKPRKCKKKRTLDQADTKGHKESSVDIDKSDSKTGNMSCNATKEIKCSISRNTEIKESDISICKTVQNKESNSSIGKIIAKKESESSVEKKIEKRASRISHDIESKSSHCGVKDDIQMEDSKNCFKISHSVNESFSNSTQKSLTSPTPICRKEKSECINIVSLPNNGNSSSESISSVMVKCNSSTYFETKSLVEQSWIENITNTEFEDNDSNQEIFNPGCTEADEEKLKNIREPKEKSQESYDLLNQISPIEIKRSIEHKSEHNRNNNSLLVGSSVEMFLKQTDFSVPQEDSDIEETSVLFERNSISNDSIGTRIVNFENSKIPIPIRTKLTEIPQKNEEVGKYYDVDEKDNPKKRVETETTTEIISSEATSNTKKENSVIENVESLNNVGKNKIRTSETLRSATNSRTVEKNISKVNNIKLEKIGRIKSKLSIFNSGVAHIHSKRKINKIKDTISRMPLNSGNAIKKTKSYASFMARRKQGEDNWKNKNTTKSSFRHVTHSSVNLENSQGIKIEKAMKNMTPKKISTKRVEKSETNNKTYITKESSIAKTKMKKHESKTGKELLQHRMNKVQDLEREIMDKIEIYRQSVDDFNKIKQEIVPQSDVPIKNSINQYFTTNETVNMICKLNEIQYHTIKSGSLLDSDSYVSNESNKIKAEMKSYCDFVEEVISEVAMEEVESTIDFSNALKTKVELLQTNRRRTLESKNRELTESILQALAYMGAEYKRLVNNCHDVNKKNEQCFKFLREKVIWLEKENEKLAAQGILKEQYTSSKTIIDEVVELKRNDDQISDIKKMYSDIEMKNNYHAQLVENFMKSVKMIQGKIEHHTKLHEDQIQRTKSEMKEKEFEGVIEQMKHKMEENQIERQDLMNKTEEYQQIVAKLKAKNKALQKELIKYKYPVHLEKNIQKMITLRNTLVNIVHKNDDVNLPLQDSKLLKIMRQIECNDTFFPSFESSSIHEKDLKSHSTTLNNAKSLEKSRQIT